MIEEQTIPNILYSIAKDIDGKVRLAKVCGLKSEGVSIEEGLCVDLAGTLRKTADYIITIERDKETRREALWHALSTVPMGGFLWYRFLFFLKGLL